MGSLVQFVCNQLKLLMGYTHQHIAPVILVRQSPHGRTEDVVLTAGGAGKKASTTKRLRQSKGAAAIDLQELGQFPQRDRLLGKSHRLKDSQSAIQALDE